MAKMKAIGQIRVSTARQADADHFDVLAQQASIEKLAWQSTSMLKSRAAKGEKHS